MEPSKYSSSLPFEEGKPIVVSFFEQKNTSFTSTFIVIDQKEKKCAIIDSVLAISLSSGVISTLYADKLISFVKEHNLTVEYVIDTHIHADHITAAHYLRERLGVKYGIGFNISTVQKHFADYFDIHDFPTDGSQFDILFQDDQHFKLGSLDCKACHTPGHTPACMTYVIGDAAFVGDTIFMHDMGTARCDFPNGSAEVLYDSIHRILKLPNSTRVFVGHDYAPGGREYQWETTVEEQIGKNKHVKHGTSKEEFVQFRTTRDKELAVPDLFYPSIQINIRGGHLPKPDANGRIFFKTPISISY